MPVPYTIRIPDELLPAPPPTDLPSDDGVPMETPRHRAQMNLLIDSLQTRWDDRKDFYCGGNMFVHFSTERVKNRDFRGPDFFVVLDTDRDREREYWAVWEEDGQYPDVIIELTSPTTEEEDRTTKKTIYERTFRTNEYYLYRPDADVVEGFRLNGRYRQIEPGPTGRLRCELLDCWLGIWTGEFQDMTGRWLRFFENDGSLVPTGKEQADRLVEFEAKRAAAAEAEVTRLKAELKKRK